MTRVVRLLTMQLLLAMALLVSGHVFSATVYSTQNGPWSDPDTWGGTLPDLTADSIVIAHTVTLRENITLESLGRLTILKPGTLEEGGNRTLKLEPGTALHNAGDVLIFMINNAGTIYNTGLIDLESDLINHGGTIYNDQMIYVKNLLTQGGMLSGNGGQYMIRGNLNSTGETIATCTGEPINICNPDGVTDPCNGPGQFDVECVTICGQVLSLDLLSFEATTCQVLGVVEITWITTHEVGVSHYSVDRSNPHSMLWETISAQIESLGNMEDGVYRYNYVDAHPEFGVNVYRLACYNLDGNVEYSFLVSAEVETGWLISVSPNPFTSSVDVYGDLSGYNMLEIVDGAGQVVRTFTGDLTRSLHLETLENGWYMLRLSGMNNFLNVPIVKLETL